MTRVVAISPVVEGAPVQTRSRHCGELVRVHTKVTNHFLLSSFLDRNDDKRNQNLRGRSRSLNHVSERNERRIISNKRHRHAMALYSHSTKLQ